MDLQMPGMDGFEATRNIRSTLRNNVPIIAVTASAMERGREKSLAAGMNDHLAQPVQIEELIACLTRWITLPLQKSRTVRMRSTLWNPRTGPPSAHFTQHDCRQQVHS